MRLPQLARGPPMRLPVAAAAREHAEDDLYQAPEFVALVFTRLLMAQARRPTT